MTEPINTTQFEDGDLSLFQAIVSCLSSFAKSFAIKMSLSYSQVVIISCGLLIAAVRCDDFAAAAAAGAIPPPPVGPPVPLPGIGGIPGIGGLGGLGFHKNLDIGAGFGPFLGLGGLGLGGLGGVPPVDGVPAPPFGLIGPSYIPSTWIGSALGAKGDLLFPIVIFIFFIVGLWTIVKFLLALIVPLIAAKFAVLDGVTHHRLRREVVSPAEERNEQINSLTSVVMAAFENVNCMEVMVCHTGNFMNSVAGDKVKEYESSLNILKAMNPNMMEIFQKAAKSGKEDCSKYSCKGMPKDPHSQQVIPDNHVN